MHLISHLAYPYLLFNLIAWILKWQVPIEYNLAILFFSILPDLDYVLDFFRQKINGKKYQVPLKHHYWPSHWPIIYVPIFVVAIITGELFFIIAASAILLHLIMDMFFCNEGMMFFYPYSNKWYNFFSKNTKEKNGLNWNKAYEKLLIYKFDKVAGILVIIHIIFTYVL